MTLLTFRLLVLIACVAVSVSGEGGSCSCIAVTDLQRMHNACNSEEPNSEYVTRISWDPIFSQYYVMYCGNCCERV